MIEHSETQPSAELTALRLTSWDFCVARCIEPSPPIRMRLASRGSIADATAVAFIAIALTTVGLITEDLLVAADEWGADEWAACEACDIEVTERDPLNFLKSGLQDLTLAAANALALLSIPFTSSTLSSFNPDRLNSPVLTFHLLSHPIALERSNGPRRSPLGAAL
ncbi:MAG TPA: hypothetical protein VMG12_32305 [Polyangiaceae bacterium]|nr:hypothetical protein [Polyangiaceae bacterium]